MNPDEIQQQNQPLDPSIIALTKAIGKAEGGDYNARGKDGEIGAYQFTPGFLQNYGPKILGQFDPQNLTPEQQDKLAYGVVKEWGTQGNPAYPQSGKLSPAEIASAWNAGDPTAYLDPEHKGISKGGAPYNTSEYVDKVQKNYEELSPYQQTPGMTEFDKNVTVPGAIAGVGLGAALLGGGGEALGGILSGIENFGGNIWQGIKGLFSPSNIGQAAVGAGLNKVASAIGGQPGDFTSSLLSGINQSQGASKTLAESIVQSLSNNPSDRKFLQDPNAKLGIQGMSEYGHAPDVDENGAMDFRNAFKKSRNDVADLSKAVASSLDAEGEMAHINEAVAEAKKNVREYSPSNEWAEADKHIDQAAKTYTKNFGTKGAPKGTLGLGIFQRMKQELGHGQKFGIMETSAKKNAYKALSQGARSVITKHTKNKELYEAAMKEEQKLINAQRIMKRLNGKKAMAPKSMLRDLKKTGGRYASLFIGDKLGGPMGAIVGDMFGRHVMRAIDKSHGKTIFETPSMRAAIKHLQTEHPNFAKALAQKLKESGIRTDVKEGLLQKLVSNKSPKNRNTQKKNKRPNKPRGNSKDNHRRP